MKPITNEWVVKAEGDLVTAQRELAAAESPNYDASAFHAQQCAEKYLKARLVEADVAFPRTHDLGALLKLVLPLEPGWMELRDELNALTALGIEVRYPGTRADAADAAQAVATAQAIRVRVRRSLAQGKTA